MRLPISRDLEYREMGEYSVRDRAGRGILPRNGNGFKVRYYLAYFSIFSFLVASNWVFLVNSSNPLSIFLFIVMAFLFIGLTYNILDVICYYLCRPDRLPALESLDGLPKRKVAMLYCCYNDVDPDCLVLAGEQDHPVDVFVLDDSTDPSKRAVADDISGRKGFRVVRRPDRKGFKAGALNNWLVRFGGDYQYIAVLDSDSVLPRDFITRSLLHAEHRDNEDVSVFQGKVQIYNKDTEFTRLLSFSPMLWYPSYERLCNRMDWMMCWGHNNLLRLSHIREAGGWDEGQVSEDFALALSLYQKDKRCVMTPIETFEMCPPDYTAYKKRACRWAKGTLGCFGFLRRRGVPLSTKFMLFLTGWCTLAFFGYAIALFFMVFGYRTGTGNVEALISTAVSDLTALFSDIPALALVLFYFGFLIFGRISLAHHYGISKRAYIKQVCLGMALNMCLMLPMMYHQIKGLRRRSVSFTVTPKGRANVDIADFLTNNSSHISFTTLLLVGALFYNPITLFYNFFWLGMMVLAPLLIWRWENKRVCGSMDLTFMVGRGTRPGLPFGGASHSNVRFR